MSWTARSPFSAAALPDNRERRLTAAQVARLQQLAASDQWSKLLIGGAVLVVSVLIPALMDLPSILPWLVPIGGGLFGVSLLLLATPWANPLRRDLRAPRLGFLDGEVSKSVVTDSSESNSAPTYRLQIGGRRLELTADEYEAAPSAGVFRAYVLPHSRHVVNMEPTDARTPPPG
jgi:hypothetical protein